MDLYEALKAGTSAEELLKTFHKDLDKANARIAEEKRVAAQKEANKQRLIESREFLANAIAGYCETLMGEKLNEPIDINFIIEAIKEVEEEMKNILIFAKEFDNISATDINSKDKEPTKIKITTTNFDDDIITSFIKNLR